MRVDANILGSRVDRGERITSGSLTRMIGILAVLLLGASSAFGEFLVQPIILKRQVLPGRRVQLDFRIENLSPDTTETVSLRIVDLTQDSDGIWQEVDPNDPNSTVDVASLRSCKSWLTNPIESVTLDPWQISPVTLWATIPGGTRGFYFAALVAKTAPRETEISGVTSTMSVQYLVPIILESQTGTLPHQIELTDMDMKYIPPTVEYPTPVVKAYVGIANKGGTYSRLMAQVRIWKQSRGYWRKITEMTLPETGIIPGVTLNLKQDLPMLLSDGKYRVEGYLYVDGRRGNAIQEEIDFKGDPRYVGEQIEVPIDLDKEDLLIDVLPNSTRGGSVLVGNGSEEPVKVSAEIILPEHMLNAVSGRGVKGEDLSCVNWVTVQPKEFTLNRYGRRNLNLIVKMPGTATEYSHYYGTLRLHVTYPDGSPGGTQTVRVCLRNGKVPAQNLIDAMPSFTMSQAAPSRYVVTAGFSNGGVTHVTPKCRGIVSGSGGVRYKQFLMTSEAYGQRGIFLPFETRTFGGTLDVSDVPNGTYFLTAAVEFPTLNAKKEMVMQNVQNQMVIEVYEQGGQKSARVVGWEQSPDGSGRTTIQL